MTFNKSDVIALDVQFACEFGVIDGTFSYTIYYFYDIITLFSLGYCLSKHKTTTIRSKTLGGHGLIGPQATLMNKTSNILCKRLRSAIKKNV